VISTLWRRYRRPLRITLFFAFGVYVAVLLVAWLFGVDTGGGRTQTLAPADATRNFPDIAPKTIRSVLPFVLQLGFAIVFIVIQFVALFWYMSRGRTYTILPGEYDVTFNDVRGQPQIVETTKQVMKLFQGYRDFRKVGGYPPHGILLEGPPGTGKTLLAKAIAGESGVPFVYTSGSGFANMFMGVGNLRVMRMFTKARRYSERWGGCVIFIDELDAVGGTRGAVSTARTAWKPDEGPLRQMMGGMMGGGGMGIVNEFLTQMDGIDTPKRWRRMLRRRLRRRPGSAPKYNILVIGATNRASTLDPALLRPGRFDRKIHVGNPSEEGRKDVIAYYLNKVQHAPIDIDRFAAASAGWSPARIKNIINEALIFALQGDRDALTYDDIWQAKLTDEIGLVEQVTYSAGEKAATALHEAAHAVAGHFMRPNQPIQVVTVRKRGETLGLVHTQLEEERFSATRSEIRANIMVSLAGMVAEEIWLGEPTTGPSGDLQSATARAVQMVTHLGMGPSLTSLGLLGGRAIDDDLAVALKDPEIRQAVDRILQECQEEVRAFLLEKRLAVEALRNALIERDELNGDEFRMLLWEIGAIAEKPRVLAAVPIMRLDSDGQRASGNGSHPVAEIPPVVLTSEPPPQPPPPPQEQ
jgi:cell division protease FtsH